MPLPSASCAPRPRCVDSLLVLLAGQQELGQHALLQDAAAIDLRSHELAQLATQRGRGTHEALGSEENKQAVNDVVHPAVALDFMQSDFQWLESAILFDSGFQRRVPFARVVCVSAPEDVRVSRIMARDAISQERALEWIHRQMPQDQVEAQSDFVILNDGIVPLEPQVEKLIRQLDSQPLPPKGSNVSNHRS